MNRDILWPHRATADAIATLLQPHAEVVIHDLSNGKIDHIAHSFSHRTAGDDSLTQLGPDEQEQAVIGPYPKTNWDGRPLRSITAVLRSGPGQPPLGLLCINLDISMFQSMQQLAQNFLSFQAPVQKTETLFGPDWREEVNEIVGQFLCDEAVSLASMTRLQRDRLIGLLEARGIFDIRNAPPYVAQVTCISRATLYNTLKKIRSAATP